MKLTYEDKVQIYELRKKGESFRQLSNQFGINISNLQYMIKLINRYGIEIVKCMFIDEPEILDAAIEKMPAEFYERYSINKSAPFYLELLKKNVDKGSAITHLAEKLGLTKDETMAIGDEENDRAMLEVVGNPVVMENGNPELKKIAKYITKTNDESGVAHAIRKWVL